MTEKRALVSIHCLTYNHEKYIRDALEGFVMQITNFPFVAIVHDDASTDGTAAIVREYAERYPDIIIPIFQTENQYSKRNGAIGRAFRKIDSKYSPSYIALCEGDDYWTDPYKLQKQIDFLEARPEALGCYTDVDYLLEDGKIPHLVKNYGIPRDFEDHLMREGYIAPLTWVFRVDMYNQLKPSKPSVDGSFALALDFLANSKFIFIDEVTGIYRDNPTSVTHYKTPQQFYRRKLGIWKIQRDYIKRYPEFVSTKNKAIIRDRIFKLANLAWYIHDEQLLKLALRYSKRRRLIVTTIKLNFLLSGLGRLLAKRLLAYKDKVRKERNIQ